MINFVIDRMTLRPWAPDINVYSLSPRGGGGGGYSGFQVTRMMADGRIFLGLKFSIPGFFWVRKFGKYFFE